MRFAELRYIPTLLLRQQELRAVLKLTSAEKEQLFPLFRLRPWAGKKPFSRSIEKVIESLGDRPFACDLDDYYSLDGAKDRLSVQEFRAIADDPSTNKWYDLVKPFEKAIPSLRLTPSAADIVRIVNRTWIAERGFGVVLSTTNQAHHFKLEEILRGIPHSNFFVVVDAGWSKDPLAQAAWATSLALRVFDMNPLISLFVSSSSFPDAFGEMGTDGKIGQVLMNEFALHSEVARQVALKFNESQVRYADWATTRPPGAGGGGIWIPRIDVPQHKLIQIFRDRPKPTETIATTCTRLAGVATKTAEWPSPPPSWGHYSVDLTASGAESGIYHQSTNTAARINMYLHQALATPALTPASLEEKFEG